METNSVENCDGFTHIHYNVNIHGINVFQIINESSSYFCKYVFEFLELKPKLFACKGFQFNVLTQMGIRRKYFVYSTHFA